MTLIHRAQKGEESAFEQLVLLHQKQVYNLSLRMVHNPDDALDLSQEAFLKAWRGLASYRTDASFSTWLYRLTTNVCIDFLRKEQKTKTVSLTRDGDEDEGLEKSIPDDGADTHHLVEQKMEHQAMAEAMAQLEPEYRQALILRVVNGLSYEEIGQTLDIKVGTVKSRIARAREKMRHLMEKSWNKPRKSSSNPEERR